MADRASKEEEDLSHTEGDAKVVVTVLRGHPRANNMFPLLNGTLTRSQVRQNLRQVVWQTQKTIRQSQEIANAHIATNHSSVFYDIGPTAHRIQGITYFVRTVIMGLI